MLLWNRESCRTEIVPEAKMKNPKQHATTAFARPLPGVKIKARRRKKDAAPKYAMPSYPVSPAIVRAALNHAAELTPEQKRFLKIERIAEKWFARVVEALAQYRNLPPAQQYFEIKPRHKVLLLRLKSWHWRYKLSLAEIMEMILSHFDASKRGRAIAKRPHTSAWWGVSVYQLTGNRAHEILLDTLRQRYPNNEHISMWRCEQQRIIVDIIAPTEMFDWQLDPINSAAPYRASIAQYRKNFDHVKRMALKRPFPGNPWTYGWGDE